MAEGTGHAGGDRGREEEDKRPEKAKQARTKEEEQFFRGLEVEMLRLKMKLRDAGKDLGKLQENMDEYDAVCKKIDDLIAKGKNVKKQIITIKAGTTALPKKAGQNMQWRWPWGRPFRNKFFLEVRGMQGKKIKRRRSMRRKKGKRGGEVVMNEVRRGGERNLTQETKEEQEEHEAEVSGNYSYPGIDG